MTGVTAVSIPALIVDALAKKSVILTTVHLVRVMFLDVKTANQDEVHIVQSIRVQKVDVPEKRGITQTIVLFTINIMYNFPLLRMAARAVINESK